MKIKKCIYRHIAALLSLAILSAGITLPASHASAAKTKKIKLNKTKLKLSVGKTYKLKLSRKKGKIKWSSSKKKVASVNAKGVVKAKKAGKATITATVKRKKYKCKVTVTKPKQTTPGTTAKATTAPAKAPATVTATTASPALPTQTPFIIPTPIPPTPIPSASSTPENPDPTPSPAVSETAKPTQAPIELSELAKNISLQSDLLTNSILITVTNNNPIWVSDVIVNYSFCDTEQNDIAASYALIPSMQPEETVYITVPVSDPVTTIDESASQIYAEATEADSETNDYLDLKEDITLTDELSDTPAPMLSVNLTNHSKYDSSIFYTVFYYDADHNIKDAYSSNVDLAAKTSSLEVIDPPLDESTGSLLYTDYEVVYTAHGMEMIDPLAPYIEKISLTPEKTTHTAMIKVKNTNNAWLSSVNLDYQLYDSDDQFLMSEELLLYSMKPNETQWVTITAEPNIIEMIDWDQSFVNITVEPDSGDYTYGITEKVTVTAPTATEEENSYEFTISNGSTADAEGSYLVRFRDSNGKVIAAQYGLYSLMAGDGETPGGEETIVLSGPVSYDESGNPVYASSCEVQLYASHVLL